MNDTIIDSLKTVTHDTINNYHDTINIDSDNIIVVGVMTAIGLIHRAITLRKLKKQGKLKP